MKSPGTTARPSCQPARVHGVGGTNLGEHVVKRGRADNREADQKDIGLRVRERSKAVVVFLTGSIPETQADGLVVHHDIGRIVVKAMVHTCKLRGRRARQGAAKGEEQLTRSECIPQGTHWWYN